MARLHTRALTSSLVHPEIGIDRPKSGRVPVLTAVDGTQCNLKPPLAFSGEWKNRMKDFGGSSGLGRFLSMFPANACAHTSFFFLYLVKLTGAPAITSSAAWWKVSQNPTQISRN